MKLFYVSNGVVGTFELVCFGASMALDYCNLIHIHHCLLSKIDLIICYFCNCYSIHYHCLNRAMLMIECTP